MPEPPLPGSISRFLAEPNPAVIATIAPGGEPHTVATWYLWEDDRVVRQHGRGPQSACSTYAATHACR